MKFEESQHSSAGKGQPSPPNVSPPTIQLPKGGGAIRGIGEKFSANPVTGTGSMSVPIAISPGRSGFGPQLALSYDSGAGNGPFSLGWHLSHSCITRNTEKKGVPCYVDDKESDIFNLADVEELVPLLDNSGPQLPPAPCQVYGRDYLIRRYRPRVEGMFALIERWTDASNASSSFWRTVSRDNVTTWYGRSETSRIYDPANPARIFEWRICETYDDKGNVISYEYAREDGAGVPQTTAGEQNRSNSQRCANSYLKHIRYGNLKPFLPSLASTGPVWATPDDIKDQYWMFEVVFDYGEHEGENPLPIATAGSTWKLRADPFSTHRAGFEIRTYRLCRRVLMFHHFPGEPDVGENCLVRSTEFEYAVPEQMQNPEVPGYTVLKSVSYRNYQRRKAPERGYESRQFAPVTFAYSIPKIDPVIRTIAPDQLENMPVGTQGPGYWWIDLDGEGLSGVLAECLGALYYKPNEGAGRFGPQRLVACTPAMVLSGGSRHQYLDLAGNGSIDVVDFSGSTPGFYERDLDDGWKRHVPFVSLPNIDWQDANLRFIDLTGDGHADALITEHEVFTWYPSLAERGFDASNRVPQAIDEDVGPRLIFADGTQTIFLADMCGDGLTDLVRIRNGEVCYWPNFGYGRFGRKVTMGNAPQFDHPDMYDPQRIRLADIDGSGPIDIIYLGRKGAQLYFNRSGNSLSGVLTIDFPLATENLGAVRVADLLGNGTACLVWNSHLPADAAHPVRYIELMAEGKPHLLTGVDNNLGSTTEIEYKPSTHFYLEDKRNRKPWVTRLPFPVHCVSKVTVKDIWRGTTFSSTYSYHHGYFDGIEREFRGFGRAETLNIEKHHTFAMANSGSPHVTDDHALYQPPVKTVTWYHTGAALDYRRILGQFEAEYFSQRYADRLPDPAKDTAAFFEKHLPEPELPAGLNAEEWREALRACKGMVLRQEIYELDAKDFEQGKETEVRLFTAAMHNSNIQCVQRRGENRHAVFLVTESEALTYHYELDLSGSGKLAPDPRVAHTLNLHHDEYGNPQQSVAVGYARWQPGSFGNLPKPELIRSVQAEEHIAYNETRYTDDCILRANQTSAADAPDPSIPVRHHRLRLPCEVRTYELKGIARTGARYLDLADLRQYDLSETYGHGAGAVPPLRAVKAKAYHEYADGSVAQKRIIEHARTLYFDDASDSAAPSRHFPFGKAGPRGLKYEDYKLALTDELLDAVFKEKDPHTGAVTGDKLAWKVDTGITARDILNEPVTKKPPYLKSGYILGSGIDPNLTGQYWMRSGTAGFAQDAHEHFFLPERYTDPFDNVTQLAYDKRDLFILSSKDAMGNVTGIHKVSDKPRFDYRVLAPIEMVDANGNHSEVAFDIRGLVVAAAAKGKKVPSGQWEGDNLDGFGVTLANPSPQEVVAFCTTPQFDDAKLQKARDWLGNASSRFVYHFGETLDASGKLQWGQHMPGACGIAREVHASQPGGAASPLQIALECSDGSGNALMKKVQAEPDPVTGKERWIVNGLTILNNKGKPVRQYEPAFSDRFGCEMPQANGVSTTTYYDAADRPVRVEMPDGAFSRVEFSPWFSRSFDANDTVLESAWYQANSRDRFDPVNPLPLVIPGLGTPPTPDERAGWLAAQHANTPAETHFDSLGREVIAIAHNRTKDGNGVWQGEKYLTYTKLDAEGKPLWIRDARSNLVMQYITPAKVNNDPSDVMPANAVPCYDIAGNLLYQHSMDAGDRWMLNDAAGKPMLVWDLNETPQGDASTREERLYSTDYDALHRPTGLWLKINNGPRVKVEHYEYQDAVSTDTNNLNGQLIRHYDPSGLVETVRRDFKGNVLEIRRRLVQDARASIVDWQGDLSAKLESEAYVQLTEHDALNRMVRLENWHLSGGAGAVYTPTYNERGALKSETFNLRGVETEAIKEIRYNAKGQKEYLKLGNGTITRYSHDPQTFRLLNIKTTRPLPSGDKCSSAFNDATCIQDLGYTYDPVGNITEIADAAQATRYGNNQRIDPVCRYEYDALYRLTTASGRESGALSGAPQHKEGDAPEFDCPAPDPAAMRNYTQRYVYDSVGNILQMKHELPGTPNGWTRGYAHAFDDPNQPASNRLWQTWTGGDRTKAITYGYDTHGSMLNLAKVPDEYKLQWDHRDMIREINLGGGGTAHYQYDSGKQRTRKRIVNQNGTGYWERIYLGGYERYRRYEGMTLKEEIETHHLFEGEQRVLMVDDVIETDRMHANGTTYKTGPIYRYQYSNHLGSACLELDHVAAIISYEEYHPYGTSAYRAKQKDGEAPAKRYRYTGMERDEESGLNLHHARTYAPWLSRWISSDPSWLVDGVNLYQYARSNSLKYLDESGRQVKPASADEVLLWKTISEKELAKTMSIGQVHIPPYDPTPVWGMLPNHESFAGPKTLYEREKLKIGREVAFERMVRTVGNIAGGVGGTIGYMLGGDKGSDVGAVFDQFADAEFAKNLYRRYRPTTTATRTPPKRQLKPSVRASQKESKSRRRTQDEKDTALRLDPETSIPLVRQTPPDKVYWNKQEIASAQYLERTKGSVVLREVEIWVKKDPRGNWEKVSGMRFDALELEKGGGALLHEWSTMRQYMEGEAKFDQIQSRIDFFLTAVQKRWQLGGRPQGHGGLYDITKTSQVYQLYPHWERPGDVYRVDMPK